MNSNIIRNDILKYSFFTSIFLITYILFYHQATGSHLADLKAHIRFIPELINEQKYAAHPMFHYITYYASLLLGVNISIAAALVNAALVTLLAGIVYKIFKLNLIHRHNTLFMLFLVFVVIFSGNFFLPGYGPTKNHFVGNGAIGTWHNVTLYMVKPFAFLSFFLLFYALDKNKNILKLFVVCAILAILSIPAKPSFILIFSPMLFLLCFFSYFHKDYRIHLFPIIYFSFTVLIISFIWILFMYYKMYGGESSGHNHTIIIAPFAVWSIFTDNIPLSIFITNVFVISFTTFAFHLLSVRSYFAIIMLIEGIFLLAVFAEKGSGFASGNFGWSYAIAQQLAYLSVMIDFVNQYEKFNSLQRSIFSFALSLHIVGGVYYFIKLMNGIAFY